MNIQACEICGKVFIAAYGYSLGVQWLVTGHAYVPAFLCPNTNGTGQHWGCTPEHALQAATNCLQSHMNLDAIRAKHQATGRANVYADDQQHLAQSGHFVNYSLGR